MILGLALQGYLAYEKATPPRTPPKNLGIGYGRVLGRCVFV